MFFSDFPDDEISCEKNIQIDQSFKELRYESSVIEHISFIFVEKILFFDGGLTADKKCTSFGTKNKKKSSKLKVFRNQY